MATDTYNWIQCHKTFLQLTLLKKTSVFHDKVFTSWSQVKLETPVACTMNVCDRNLRFLVMLHNRS
jgi:hypothetical protein